MSDSNSTQIAPTPKTDLVEHFQNFGEGGLYFAASVSLALATVYFRQLEVVLIIVYIAALVYSVLSFGDSPRMSIFRVTAITAGVILGIRELLIFFWVSVTAVVLGVLALTLIILLAYRWLQVALTLG